MLNPLHPDISILDISIVLYFHDLNEWFTSIRRNKKLVSLMVFQVWNCVRCDCFFFLHINNQLNYFLIYKADTEALVAEKIDTCILFS